MKLPSFAPLFLLSLLAGTAFGAATPARPRTEYEILRAIPAERLRALMGDVPDAQGFIGTNRRAVIVGVVTDDLAYADNAWRGIDATFARQRADGGFVAGERPNGTSAKPFPAAIQTAFFFMQELGRAILVIRESPHEAHFHARIAELEPKMRRAMAFITSGYDTIIAGSSKAVNRIFIAAKAFGLCGLVLHDETLVATSRRLVTHGLTLRDQDGVFIEHGGRDSSYNVASILFGQVLALHLSLPELEAVLPAAVAWELTRIGPGGEVDVTGNTRTGVGKEKSYFGDPKAVNYGEVVQALTLYGLVHHDEAYLAAAEKVFAYGRALDKKAAK